MLRRAALSCLLALLAGCHAQRTVDLWSDEPRLEERFLRDRRRLALRVDSTLRSLGEAHVFFFTLPLLAYSSHTNYVTDPGAARELYRESLVEDLTTAGFEVVGWKDEQATHRLHVEVTTFDYYDSWSFLVVVPFSDHRSALVGAEAHLSTPEADYARAFKSFDLAEAGGQGVEAQLATTWRHSAREVALAVARQCAEEEERGPPDEVGEWRSDTQRTPAPTAWTALKVTWVDAPPD